MTHYDLTKDGKVDRRELRTVAYMDHKLPPTISDDIFRKADRNDDKFIDRTEVMAAARLVRRHVARATLRWLEDHDTDGDGLLSEMELFESIYMELGLSMRDVKGCFQESDVNKDKYLTSSELVETLHCSRLLALKEGKGLLKVYDTDGDHRLNIQEAQMLAGLRYDIEPSYATLVFKDISHRTDHTINELELVDYLTKLREEAAIAALNKLSGLDKNGDEAVSFSELLQEYEKQLEKSILKKIFSKVDVNKNAHIDPIEFVSLQNLIADELRLQMIQNDFEQQYSASINATTSLPTLIIFKLPKKRHIQRQPRQRKRRSDPEADEKLMVSDKSHPGIREVTAVNTSGVYFSTVVTAVPKFMKSSNEYQEFLSDGAKLISEIFANSKRPENKDIGTDKIKKTQENSISDENISPFIPTMMQKDRKLKLAATNEDKLETSSGTDKSGHVRNQNGALINSPNIAYIKKFEKFFDFLQKAIKRISKVLKENSRKQAEGLKSPLRSINIIKHSSQIADNTSNTEASEIKKIASDSKNSILTPTTEKLKTQKDLDETIYERIHNENDFIVHTPVDLSEYKATVAEKFGGFFGTPFLQLDKNKARKEVKMINYEKSEHEQSLDEASFYAAEKIEEEFEVVNEDGCILESQTDSSDSDYFSEHPTRQRKRYKCNTKPQTLNKTSTGALQKTSNKFKETKLPSESNGKFRNQKKQRLQHKRSNESDSLENGTILPLLQDVVNESSLLKTKDKPSAVGDKVFPKHDNDEAIEMIPEEQGNEESDELSGEKASTKHINLNELSQHESKNEHNKSILQPLDSRMTNKYTKQIHSKPDSMGLGKISSKTKGKNYHHMKQRI
ncbi:EF hand family protein [Loa loa]|uniref:EF hand family protein n=1 Tax=Loa loa TaxID=7209 RepID=A0A1S0UKJ0_LOALO|nr:EF hand family protein [Loa loa]EJD75946.1 EF hand family protein [Loa loa]